MSRISSVDQSSRTSEVATRSITEVQGSTNRGGGLSEYFSLDNLSRMMAQLAYKNVAVVDLARQTQTSNAIKLEVARQERVSTANDKDKKAAWLTAGFGMAGGFLGFAPMFGKAAGSVKNRFSPKVIDVISNKNLQRVNASYNKKILGEPKKISGALSPATADLNKAAADYKNSFNSAKGFMGEKQIAKLEPDMAAWKNKLNDYFSNCDTKDKANIAIYRNHKKQMSIYEKAIAKATTSPVQNSEMSMSHYISSGGGPLLNATGQLVSTPVTQEAGEARNQADTLRRNNDMVDRDVQRNHDLAKSISQESQALLKSANELSSALTAAYRY